MTIDRNKFSGAKMSALKDVQKGAKENQKSTQNDGRVGFHTVEDGKNVFRILPPHPDCKVGSCYLAKRTAMLKCEVPVYQDGVVTDKTEVKLKSIFCATQHGGLPKDPIELYTDYVRSQANDTIENKTERQQYLYPITGWRDNQGWHWGMGQQTTFVCYAIKNNELKRLELYETWIKEMNKLSITEEPSDVITVDPFSDPNEGFPLIITKGSEKDKNGKDKTTYVVTKDELSRTRRESWEEFFERTRVTDAQLEELINQAPLSDMYGTDLYSKWDWSLAIDGLRRFDEEHKYKIFENTDFLDELQELEKLVPKPRDKDADIDEMMKLKVSIDAEAKTIASAAINKAAEILATTAEDEVTLAEMKIMLKRHIRKEFGDAFVSQLPTSDKDVIKWYKLYDAGKELPIDDDPNSGSNKIDEVESKISETASPVQTSVASEGAIQNSALSDEIAKLRAGRSSKVKAQ